MDATSKESLQVGNAAKMYAALKEIQADVKVWNSIYANELQAAVRDAREVFIRESSYVETLIKAAVIAETKRQRNELLALAVKTLESGNDAEK